MAKYTCILEPGESEIDQIRYDKMETTFGSLRSGWSVDEKI